MLRSALVWAFTWIYMLLAGLASLPWLALTGRLGFTYAAARLGIRGLLFFAGVRVVVEGREHLPASGPRLYMANHQSNLDPPILLAVLPGEIAFLAKRELFRVPVLGWVLRLGGYIPVDRGDRDAARASVARAAQSAAAGRHFLVFPEGTRSPDGRLLDFKKGPFYLAEQAAVPIVPVALVGTGRLMARGSMRIRTGRVTVLIAPPIPPSAWASAPDPRAAAAAAVRAALQAHLLPQGGGPDSSLSGAERPA